MPLAGDLKTFFITTILQLLHNNAKSGVLRVWGQDDMVRIFFQDGAIIYAMKSQHDNRLGQLLKQQGLISDQQLQECLVIGREKKLTLGKVVFDKGYVGRDCLERILFKQAENTIFEMIFWENGRFEYKEAMIDLDKLIVNKMNTMSVILEASRRIDEMSVFKKQIPEDTVRFRLSEKAEGFKDIVLNEEELQIILLIDGRATVGDIIRDGLYDPYFAYKTLNALITSGYIEPVEGISRIRQAEAAFQDMDDQPTENIN
ncbi:MAG: DUF4388 domain-containing protein [Desulfosalsimonadaceae bacterium]